jgi:uncharacterized membrane protein YfcA
MASDAWAFHVSLTAVIFGFTLQPTRLALVVIAAFVAGIMNAIAGGGTLVTFPALVAAGITPLIANATSTTALVPGALSSMWGYRRELTGARRWTTQLFIPSLAGGFAGAWLLLHTPNATFERVVPWLVLLATGLFALQPHLFVILDSAKDLLFRTESGAGRSVRSQRQVADDAELTARGPTLTLLAWQFAIGIYGGYFGAGVGILMLAALGFMGFANIHRMNGLKNWGGFCMNLVAVITFATSGIVIWPIALAMAASATLGGYVGSRGAQRVPKSAVRAVVMVIGFTSGIWLLLR